MSGGGSRTGIPSPGKDLVQGAGEIAPLSGNGNFPGRPHPTMGGVYFVTDGENIKIGYSGAPVVRLTDLQAANARPLAILGVIAGTYATEGKLHARFQNSRVRGEWFKPVPEMLAFIKEACGDSEALMRFQPPLRTKAQRLGVSEDALEMSQKLTAWARERGQGDFGAIVGRQILLAAMNPQSGALRQIVAASMQRLTQETSQASPVDSSMFTSIDG